MSINITVEPSIDAVVELKARKSLDGDIMIFDHPEIDIVVSGKKNKILALSKEQYGDHVYATQSRFFEFLSKKGVIDTASIRGGNIYGSLEGMLLESVNPEESDSVQSAIYSELFTFEYNLANLFLLGCLSSGTSYVLCTVFGDDGVKYEHKLLDG